ncbi:Pre-mRNA-splicing factor ATP-dependent RNA helicase-like protein cdc28 [Monoraphidium neglectum]|uniref:Pre-mRNA-splicing factor ATP-dependent RNA helicase-like protein cdc28 n=1 Tax=Monoraphidium neglectum TaxID=145388 RepID=A0A0D2KYR4_9CHLO|nr:Pre-mRNA-splicing factor ATP-dependent RNA helicase-like protein cdc28 [Monoraphidium neglectum]KIZ00349.1 Pre-mRNA-splicing factor ATP-dependent RNA helicase-like protein cdc28 [Monoraphidium neglectum]|eukprot:XP_013899368.1 Pre-mRNA-splicing factor ATP-dependent RNA helicase-like protein cdc28 [Monoraphidium neglectum]
MASDRELRSWVSDRLHELVGFSDRTTADFILAQAKKVKGSAPALGRHLSAAGLPDNAAVAAFCGELLSRLPSSSGAGGGGSAAARQAAAEARSLVKRSRGYGLLEDEEDDAEEERRRQLKQQQQQQEQQQQQQQQADAAASGRPQRPTDEGSKPRGEKHLRRSKAAVDDGDRDGGGGDGGPRGGDDPTVVRSSKRSKRRWEEDEEGGGAGGGRDEGEGAVAARREAELEADQREREEFEARLRERDEAKTKKLADEEPRESKKDRERRRAAGLAEEDRAALVPMLRDVSRQEYLAKREADKLAALEDEIRDEEFLFAGKEHLLTERERADIAYKRRVLELARERKRQLDSLDQERYQLPQSYDAADAKDSRLAVAKARYVEPKGDEADAALPNAEQERWEREQLARTKYRGGVASVQAAAAAEDAAKYELLFEDQIEYVKGDEG